MQWKFRQEIVSGAGSEDVKILNIPEDAIEIRLFQERTSDIDFFVIACWLEPVKEDKTLLLKYPTLDTKIKGAPANVL